MLDAPRTLPSVSALPPSAALAGCAGFESAGSGPAAEAPAYRVGDRWIYRAQDGFLAPERWEETHAISAIGADGISARITQKGPSDRRRARRAVVRARPREDRRRLRQRNAALRHAARALPVSARRRRRRWSQFVDNYNEATKATGQINHYVRVRGWEKVTTPAGTFDALAMHVVMRLDDEEFWRYADAMQLHRVVRAGGARRRARGEAGRSTRRRAATSTAARRIRTQNAVVELLSFTPGS